MQQYDCLVCGQKMTEVHKIKFVDYYCAKDDHHFSWRVIPLEHLEEDASKAIAKLRIRVGEDKNRMCLKIHYDEGYSEVWSTPHSSRIRVEQIIAPDFQDLEKLKDKLRTILVFA